MWRVPCIAQVELITIIGITIKHCTSSPVSVYFSVFLSFRIFHYFNFSFIFIAIHILFFFRACSTIRKRHEGNRSTDDSTISSISFYLFSFFFSILFFFLILFIADRRGATFHRCLYNNIRYLM